MDVSQVQKVVEDRKVATDMDICPKSSGSVTLFFVETALNLQNDWY